MFGDICDDCSGLGFLGYEGNTCSACDGDIWVEERESYD